MKSCNYFHADKVEHSSALGEWEPHIIPVTLHSQPVHIKRSKNPLAPPIIHFLTAESKSSSRFSYSFLFFFRWLFVKQHQNSVNWLVRATKTTRWRWTPLLAATAMQNGFSTEWFVVYFIVSQWHKSKYFTCLTDFFSCIFSVNFWEKLAKNKGWKHGNVGISTSNSGIKCLIRRWRWQRTMFDWSKEVHLWRSLSLSLSLSISLSISLSLSVFSEKVFQTKNIKKYTHYV